MTPKICTFTVCCSKCQFQWLLEQPFERSCERSVVGLLYYWIHMYIQQFLLFSLSCALLIQIYTEAFIIKCDNCPSLSTPLYMNISKLPRDSSQFSRWPRPKTTPNSGIEKVHLLQIVLRKPVSAFVSL